MLHELPLTDFNLHYVDQGTGPVILFVHGFPLDHSMWQHQIECFSSSFRCLAPDLRGFGQSEFAAEEITMQQLAIDLDQLLQLLSLDERVTVCGLSMGGYVAWQFWQHYRRRVGKLILCDTKAEADSEEVARGRRMMAQSVLAEGPAVASQAMIPKLVSTTTAESQPEVVEQLQAVIECTSPTTIAAVQRGMANRPDMTQMLPSIDCPTLVIVGDQDVITPPSEMSNMAHQLPHATCVQINDAGHLPPIENPTAVNDAIAAFLGEALFELE